MSYEAWLAFLGHSDMFSFSDDHETPSLKETLDALADSRAITDLDRVQVLQWLAVTDKLDKHRERVEPIARRLVQEEADPQHLLDEIVSHARVLPDAAPADVVTHLLSQNVAITSSLAQASDYTCSVDAVVIGGADAYRITAGFSSKQPMSTFEYALDPNHWHDCFPEFFLEGTEVLANTTAAMPDPAYDGWTGILNEVVAYPSPTGPQELVTELAVRVWKRDDGQGIGMDYDLVDSKGKQILVDHGYTRATPLPNGGCRVEAAKTVAFSELPVAAGAACVADFWPKVMQKMGECKGAST